MAQKNSESYSVTPPFINAASGKANQQPSDKQGQTKICYMKEHNSITTQEFIITSLFNKINPES